MKRTVHDIGEFGLIRQFQKQIPLAGDDCAVLPGGGLLTCDPVIEGIHFLTDTPARQVGWKAMARNLSDIAAMGGEPRYAVVSLGLRPTTPVRWVRQLYDGLHAAARRFGCEIVGGDTAHVRHEQFVVVTLLGHADQPVRRSGARPGDIVFVTGRLGGAVRSGKHLRFTPRLREARWLVKRVHVHAMIDVSDGLASDLQRLVEASRVGFDIASAKIPGKLPGALSDGEDFELLFTVAPCNAGKARRKFHEIGRVIKKPVVLLDGVPLAMKGYDHFA
ncbi:MAG: thiamine-monophosphate kinase [Verrucomicrobia bacterium]|nr:thiamine-monophosphate kinase [Verrucomicrobiota bacterium]